MVASKVFGVSNFNVVICLGTVVLIHFAAADTDLTVAPPGRSAVNGTSDCPSDVAMKVLSCFSRSEILPGVLRLMSDPQHVPSFCREDQSDQLKECLQENFALCSRDPTRLGLLRLQSDPLLSHNHLLYFCQNREAVKKESNCTSYRMTTTCITEMSRKFRNNLKNTSHIKDKLQAACIYNDDLKDCLLRASSTRTTTTAASAAGTTISSVNGSSSSSKPGDGCQASVQLYQHLARAQRFPYCDLDPLTQDRLLHDVLTAPRQGDSSSSGAAATQGPEKTQDGENVHLPSPVEEEREAEDRENVTHTHPRGSGDAHLGLSRSCSSATSWRLLVALALLFSSTLSLAP